MIKFMTTIFRINANKIRSQKFNLCLTSGSWSGVPPALTPFLLLIFLFLLLLLLLTIITLFLPPFCPCILLRRYDVLIVSWVLPWKFAWNAHIYSQQSTFEGFFDKEVPICPSWHIHQMKAHGQNLRKKVVLAFGNLWKFLDCHLKLEYANEIKVIFTTNQK